METIETFLCDNGLGEYCQAFQDNGWDDISVLPDMADAQLEKCIKKDGHKMKFKKAIQQLNSNNRKQGEKESSKPQVIYNRRKQFQLNKHKPLGTEKDDLSSSRLNRIPFTAAEENFLWRSLNNEGRDEDTLKKLPSEESSESEEENNHGITVMDNFQTQWAKEPSNPELARTISAIRRDIPTKPIVEMSVTYIAHSDNTNINKAPTQVFTDLTLPASGTENLKAQLEIVKAYNEKSDKLYVETQAYGQCLDILEANHWVTILGKSGDGKSMMASHLMLRYKSQGFEQVIVSSLQDWKQLVSCKTKEFVLIDDMFGRFCLDSQRLNDWLSYLENMEKIVTGRKGELLVVSTSRKYIFEDVKSTVSKFDLFKEFKLLDLTSQSLKLSTSEKEKIFHIYAVEHEVEGFKKHDIGKLDPPHGFPHCVVLFCTDYFLRQQNGISFFKTPVECIRSEIHNFRESDPYKYLVLILGMLSNIELRRSALETLCFRPTNTVKKIFKAAGVSLPTAIPGIQKALDSLNGTFLNMGPDDCYHFSHESLAENVAAVFTDLHPVLAIEVVDFKYLLQHLWAEIPLKLAEGSPQSDVILRDAHLAPIVKRLTRELILGNLYTVSLFQIWCHGKFVNEWINYIVTDVDVEIDQVFNFQNENFNLLLFLTQFQREDALMAVLSNTIILDRIRKLPKLLQTALSLACGSNCSDRLVRAFATTYSEVFQGRLEGSELLMNALKNSNAEHAMVLIQETKINPDFIDLYGRNFISVLVRNLEDNGTFKQLFGLLTALGVHVNSEDFLGESARDFCEERIAQNRENKSAHFSLVLLAKAQKASCSNNTYMYANRLFLELQRHPDIVHRLFKLEIAYTLYDGTIQLLNLLGGLINYGRMVYIPVDFLTSGSSKEELYFINCGEGILHVINELGFLRKEIFEINELSFLHSGSKQQKLSSALKQREKTADLNGILCPGELPKFRNVISKSLEEINVHFDVILEIHESAAKKSILLMESVHN